MKPLPQLGPKCEVNQILGELVPIESGGSPEQTRAVSKRSKNFSQLVIFCGSRKLEAGSWKLEAGSQKHDGDVMEDNHGDMMKFSNKNVRPQRLSRAKQG